MMVVATSVDPDYSLRETMGDAVSLNEWKKCQNILVHPKLSQDVSHSQGPSTSSPCTRHREFWILQASKVGK